MDLQKIVAEVVEEVTKDKTDRMLIQSGDLVSDVDSMNRCIATISATVCLKILQKYHKETIHD